MLNEFDVLRIVDERLRQAGIDYMLTGVAVALEAAWA